jgi:CheY-like chemotaxis protein
VLVVEDDEALRRLLCQALHARGVDVSGARGGTEALELLPDLRPEVIVTDLLMPGMMGTRLIEVLRADGQHADTPIVVFSGFSLELMGGSAGDGIHYVPKGADGVSRVVELVAGLVGVDGGGGSDVVG